MNETSLIPVFRNGTIVYYDKNYSDTSWSYEENLEAASFFASCVEKTKNEQYSYSLTYMFIMNKKHPDMFFGKTDVSMIQSLVWISGE
jgi:hypothetical protein